MSFVTELRIVLAKPRAPLAQRTMLHFDTSLFNGTTFRDRDHVGRVCRPRRVPPDVEYRVFGHPAASASEPLIVTMSRCSPRLEVGIDGHDEEDWSVSSTLNNRWAYNLVVQYRSKFFPQQEKFLWMSWQKYVFVVLL